MIRRHKKFGLFFFVVAVVLGLATAAGSFQGSPAHAQTVTTPSITIATDQASVYEGGLAVFRLTLQGGQSGPIDVRVKTWEPNRTNDTEQVHDVHFSSGTRFNTLSVLAYIDAQRDVGVLNASVLPSTDGSYQVGAQDTATVEVLDVRGTNTPAGLTAIGIWASAGSIGEGSPYPVEFRLNRHGETSDPLTVGVRIDDPQGALRGNHWDPPPVHPTQVEFAAGSTSESLFLLVPDDQRYLQGASFKVVVLPSTEYLIRGSGNLGFEVSEEITVWQNETVQELELNFGKNAVNEADANEGDTLKFVVKRRQQDANGGKPTTFAVRVETDRSGPDRFLDDWTEDTSTGRLFKDFPLELTGNDIEIGHEIEVIENGAVEGDWSYWASIKTLEDWEGNPLTDAQEDEYWTVKQGFRETKIDVTDGEDHTGTVYLSTTQTEVYEGATVLFTLTRSGGPMSEARTVKVKTRERNRDFGTSIQKGFYYYVTFKPWQSTATLSVLAYLDGEAEEDENDTLEASLDDVGTGYQIGNADALVVEINDPPDSIPIVDITSYPEVVDEGDDAVFTLTRSGDTSSEVTVNLGFWHASTVLRGNHWEPPPDLPRAVTIPAGVTTLDVVVPVPDDQKDLPESGSGSWFAVEIKPSDDYLIGGLVWGTLATVYVIDNDDAQELEFWWGFVEAEAGAWKAGEDWRTCDSSSCIPGPAEGIFYYENGRNFHPDYNLQELWPAHFGVIRRAEDVGKTATFVVRVEHNRGWESPRHAHWPIDPVTGKHYFEFPLTLTGNQRQLVGRIEVLNNGFPDPRGWEYSAEIKRIEDVSKGTVLTPGKEAQYWTVKEQPNRLRRNVLHPQERGWPFFFLRDATPDPVAEGQQVTFTLERDSGNSLEPLEIQVRTWEPNRRASDDTNPSEQIHTFTLPAAPMTNLWVPSLHQTIEFTVTTTDDQDYETSDFLKAELVDSVGFHYISIYKKNVRIVDDDQPTVSLSVNSTSVTEGEPVKFTLTRGVNTTGELIVGVAVDDPGGFLQGNVAWNAVEIPSSVVFAPGETVKEIDLTPPDDWRDIPDSTLTFTVTQEPEFEMVGPASLTVQVANNDVAPQVQISFNHAEVYEGNDLILAVTRIGDTRNPLEIEITDGPVDDQKYEVVFMDAGQSLLNFVYNHPDDNRKGPDVEYKATLHSAPPEFWTPTGPPTVSGVILDDDPYRVGVDTETPDVDEGQYIFYRFFHDGHSEDPLLINLLRSETGSAIDDGFLGAYTTDIPAGYSGFTKLEVAEANDGSDGDAEFTIEVLPSDDYEIDPNHASVTITVRDRDPLPVLDFSLSSQHFDEGIGNATIPVDLTALLPVLRTVTVDYEIIEGNHTDGADIVESSGTLVFPADTTRALIEASVIQDLIAEGDEQFTVVLSNPVNATLQDGLTTLSAVVIINDDEPVVTLEAAAAAVNEGSDVVFNLTRSRDTSGELTVGLQVIEGAPKSASAQVTATFAAGQDTTQLTVSTEDDRESLGTYTVTALLESPSSNGQPPTYSIEGQLTASVTVRDNDLPTVRIALPSSGRLFEGELASFFLLRQHTGPDLTVSLEYNLAGDYTTGPIPTSVTIPAGASRVKVEILTEDDSVAEDAGELTVTVLDDTGYRPVYPSTFTFSIFDNDGLLPGVGVDAAESWVDEGEDVVFTVTRLGFIQIPLDARLKLNRVRSRVTEADLSDPTLDISAPVDLIIFDEEEVIVSFPAGTSELTVTRSTTDDIFNYGNSTYHAVVLAGPDDGYRAYYDHAATVWVQDDDRPTVTVTAPNTEYYGNPGTSHGLFGTSFDNPTLELSVTLTRTGDTSAHLPVVHTLPYITFFPAPLEDEPNSPSSRPVRLIPPGVTSYATTVPTEMNFSSLGRIYRLVLDNPHYCPDDPEECGYGPQYTVGTPNEANYRVYNNFMGVRIEADQATAAEGGAVTFTLHRHGGKPDAMDRPLHVTVGVTQEGDYIAGAAPETVTFQAGQASATLSVPTSNDVIDEPDGVINATILDAASFTDDEYAYIFGKFGRTPWEVYSVTTAVTDDDYVLPEVSVADVIARENDGTIEFTVSLNQSNNEEASSVDWTTQEDGTTEAATSGADFTAASGTLNFAVGETEKTVTVTLLDDDMDESHETFNFVLSNPTSLTLGTSIATGTILDDELASAVLFSIPNHDPVEEGAYLVLRIQRLFPLDPGQTVNSDDPCYGSSITGCFTDDPDPAQANVSLNVNVRVTQEGNVISGPAPTMVTFQPGSIYAYLTIPTDDDAIVEPNGEIKAEILNGAGYSPLLLAHAQQPDQYLPTEFRTVYDNDLTFSVADAAASEDAGALDFTVSLNAAAPEDVSVDVATLDGDATSHGNVTATSLGQDFTAGTQTLTFLKGEQTKIFSVALLDDSIQERAETFSVRLSNQPQFSTLADDTGVGTILDDEQPMVVSVRRAYSIVEEDQAGPVNFIVVLSHPDTVASERNVSVDWRVAAGTATEGEDYVAAGGTYNFPVGTTSDFLQVTLEDDNLLEEEFETFTVELIQQGTRLATLSTTEASFEASIRDNETLTAAITAESVSVAEGQLAAFRVTLTGALTTQATNVQFEASGDATAVEDYGIPFGPVSFPSGDSTGRIGTLQIPAGQSSGFITYPILNEGVEEDDETLEVGVFSASSGQRAVSVSPTQSSASSTILDQGALNVSIEAVPSVDEGAEAAFTVYLSKIINKDVSVEWSTRQPGQMLTAAETAEPDVDYLASTDTVIIPAGSAAAMFTISTTDDTLAEGGETFQVELEEARRGTGVSPQRIPLGVTQAFTTIVDNDDVPDGITVSASPKRLPEDAGATDIDVTVTLDGMSQLTIDTPVTIEFVNRPNVDINATFGEDYSSTKADVVIAAGQASVTTTVTLTPVDDNVAEDNEVARLSAKSAAFTDSVGLGIVIEDNDAEPVEIAITVTPETLDETAGITLLNVTASLVGQTARQVDTVVTMITDNGTAAADEDFETASITLTVPVGELSASGTLNLTLTDDTLHEGDETLEISGSAPGLMVTGAEVTIRDDDAAPTSIGLSVTASPITEGGGAVILPVEATLLGGGTRTEDTTVNVSLVDLTATETDDYTAIWDTPALTIPAGRFRATITLTLTPVQDTVYEGAETIAVRGENSDPGLPINGLRLTIGDDDPAPTTLGLSVNPDIISEAAVLESADVTATLDGTITLQEDLFINVRLVKSGPTPITIGGILLTPLVIAAGELEGTSTLIFGGFDDEVDTEDQTVEVRGTSSNPDIQVVPDEVVVKDDDTAGVSISPSSLSIREGRRKKYTIKLDSEPTSDVTVTVDLPANADFTVNPGTITFTPRSWGPKYVYVESNDDDDAADEPPTVITHTVVSSDTKYSGFAAGSVSVTITDDDDPRVEVSFEHSTYSVAESDDASTTSEKENEVTVTVTLSAVPERTVDITLILTNQGASDADYSLSATSVTFGPTETSKTFTFTAADDAEDDDGESVKLTFGSALPAGVSRGSVPETTVSINDDDVPSVTVSFGSATYPVDEGETETVTVTLSAAPEREVVVPIDTADEGGASSDDYSLSETSVTFGPTETSKTFTFTAADDAEDDDGESVKLTFGSALPAGVSRGSVPETTVSINDDDVPSVTVSFGSATYPVDEGETETVTVTLSAAPEREVVVPIDTADEGGASSDDYSLSETSVTFGPTETSKTFTFTAADDAEDDDGESVKLTFGSALPAGVSRGSVPETTVSITDDDVPSVTVSFGSATYPVDEGETETVTVTLSAAPEREVVVPIDTADEGGASSDDYSLSETSVTFGPTETSKTFTFTAADDAEDDDGESVKLTFGSALPAGVSRGSVPETVVSINDDDVPSVTVSFGSATYPVDEGETETVTVTLSAAPEREVVVPIDTTDEGGASSDDYSLSETSVTFGPTETSKTFTFTAADDAEDDDGESVKLTFGSALPAGVSRGSVPETTVSITDDDVPAVEVSFDSATYPVDEGETETVTVTLSAAPEREVVVPIDTADEGGASSDDYSLSETSVTFGPTETSKTFTFTADDDAEDDDGESVKLTFGSPLPAGVSRGSVPETTVSIKDDDVPAVEVSFDSATYPVDEGETETVTVTLSAAPEREVVVPIDTTDEGGASSADYSLSATSVTFGPTETSKTFTFTATQDTVDDDGESVKLTFDSQLPAGVSRGSVPETTVSITDDDVPSVTVSFGSATYPVDEGETETVTVTLSAAPEREVVVPIDTTDEGGASSDDYSLSETSVTFGPTETSKTFTFTAADDAEDDDGESVKLTFGSALPAGVSRGSVPETTVSITDDDVPSVTVSFGSATYPVDEGETETVTVTLSAAPEREVVVPIDTTDEGGASSDDYSLSETSVTFGPTETSKTFTFTAADDAEDDDGESVKLTFGSALPAGVSRGSVPETTVSITDDDAPSSLTVNFEASTYNVTEGSTVEVVLTLDDDPEREVTIPFSKTNQGGASDSDYVGVPTSVIFNTGEVSKSFEFSAVSDRIGDPGEKVSFKLETLPPGTTAGTLIETVVTIEDVAPQGSTTVSFGADTYGVSEGSFTTITVVMSHAPGSDATIPIMATNQGDTSNADYSLSATSVTFGPTETSKTFTFTATQDTVDDDGESVKLTFDSQLPAGVSRGSVPETTVSITDDDAPSSLTVNFKKSGYTVTEGSIEEIVLTLDDDPERTVTIPLSWSNEDGASDSDHNGVPTDVTFNAGETEKSFEFSAVSDRIGDQGETVSIKLGAPPSGVTKGTTSETVVTIEDVAPQGSTTVSFGADTYGVSEGSFTTITVVMSHAPGSDATIPIMATNQGDTSNSDYLLSATSVIFGPTDTSKTFKFTATQDSVDDDEESVDLGFGTLPTGISEGAPSETTVSITDDDVPAVEVSFEHSTYTVSEGSGVTVKVKLNAEPERTVDIPLILTNQGASVDDYSGVPTSVTFGLTDIEKTFTFTATQDSVDDDGESVKLTFDSQLPAGVSRGSVPETTVSITDDDVPGVAVSFDSATYSATEGGLDAVVTVQLSSPAPHQVEIPITAAGMNGAIDEDWTGVPEELIFASGEQSKTFTVMAYDDTVEDDGETVELGFGELPAGFVAGNPSAATVELMNMEHTSQDCGTAIWCATVTLAGYENDINGGGDYAEKVANSSLIGDNYFTYNGTKYYDPRAYSVLQHHYFYLSRFVLKLRASNGTANDYTNWTLYVDGTAFPFTQERMVAGGFRWRHPMFYHFRPGTTFELRIEETATSQARAIDEPPPAPMYLTVLENDSYLSVDWERPPMDKGPDALFYNETSVPEVTTYRVEMKKTGDKWSSARSNSISYPSSRSGFVNLSNGVEYTMRVFAINQHGESPPSPEVTGTPHEMTPPGLLTATVDGSTLILTYDEALDGAAVPEVDTFTVSVNGSDRVVQSVSIAGSQVKLTLASSVGVGDSVALSYKKPLYMDLPRIQDSVGNAASSIRNKTVTSAPAQAVGTRANSRATGAPSVGGTVEVGETLTADTSGIADANGLTNVSYSYQWIANEGKGDTNITGATDSTYTLLATDEGKTIKVSVSFTDDADNGEALISKATEAVSFAVQQQIANNQATGAPSIGGTVQVGETLTADTSGIADDDGLANVSYSYRWIGNDGGADAEITSATASTYTLVDDDEGKTIKVKVMFTDDADNREALISKATGAVAAAPNNRPTGEPTISGTAQVGQLLTAHTSGIADADGLENVTFSFQWVANDGTSDTDIRNATGSHYTLVADDEGKIIRVRVSFTDDAGDEKTLISEGTEAVSPETPTNTSARGVPTISGSARVGETLTVNTSGISDDEGMENAVFAYRWMAGGADIAGATGATYTLTGDDEGLSIQVRVSFTDDARNEEALTSAGTGAVAPVLPPLTVSLTVAAPATHDGSTEFTFEIEFSEEFPLSFKKLKLHAFDVTDGEVLKAQRVVKSSNISWRITVRPDSNADVTVVLAVTTNCGAQGAICTKDGRKLSNRLEFTVTGPTQ